MHIYCLGEGSPTIVLDHAGGVPSPAWSLVQPQLAEHTRVCSYDRAGYGWSDPASAPGDLPRMVGGTKPGTKSTVTVFRRGQSKDLSIVIAEVEPDKTAVKTSDREPRSKSSAAAQQLGLTISDLSEAQKKELKLRGGVRVDAASDAAARAGLREGDVILAIANAEVANVKDFEAAVARADKGKPVNVLFRRGEWAQYALIRPSR